MGVGKIGQAKAGISLSGGELNQSLLDVLCCPEDQGDLTLISQDGEMGSVYDGTLQCIQCGERFDIREGIPIFVKESKEDAQHHESQMRAKDVAWLLNASEQTVIGRVGKSHWVPGMIQKAGVFARRFTPLSWVLDAGTGLGWHWKGVTSPNIVAVDFVFSNLRIAKRSFLESNVDKNIHLVCADLSRLPIRENSMDGVWSVQTLQHLPPEKLSSVLEQLRDVLREDSYLELYWLNYSILLRIIYRLGGRSLPRETQAAELYIRRVDADELKEFLKVYFPGQIRIRYNETFFHPELRVQHRLRLMALDKALSSIPILNRVLAHQIVAEVRLNS